MLLRLDNARKYTRVLHHSVFWSFAMAVPSTTRKALDGTGVQCLPRALYRFVVGDAALNNHIDGYLWFRSHEFFRRLEGGDESEGIGSYVIPGGPNVGDVSDDYPIQPAYFMSFSEDPNAAQKHGDCGLELRRPHEFLEKIKKELPSCSSFVKVEWIKIEYNKTNEVDTHPSPSESLYRKFHCKPENFADEKEWRLQIQFLHSFRIQNQTLKFKWGQSVGTHFSPYLG